MYETFDHTADLGVRVTSPDLNTLFAEAALGMFASIVENIDQVQPATSISLSIEGKDREYLLFDWLRELLFRFDADHMIFSQFEVLVTSDGLTATVRGELLDRSRHLLNHEVKAITYHELKIEQIPEGWQAEFIVDI
jgi:SHS2 domain-containing protein